jgi:RES domain-containing protein
MPKLPEPPAPLTIPALATMLPAGTRLWRIYATGGAHPAAWDGLRFFGPTHSRFDHHDLPPQVQAKGILYAAREPTTCVAEVFQVTRTIDRTSRGLWLVGFELRRAAVLLALTGHWPTQAGASMAINSGPRPRAQRWSRAIYAAYPDVVGLLYASSMHANKPAVALYERAQNTLPAAPVFNRALADPALLPRLSLAAGRLGYGIL